MRLIDADALIAEMHNVILEDGEDRRTFYEVIERQPTIEERKRGKWISQDHNKVNNMTSTAVYYYPKCSVCGYCAYPANFCPNCGADMRGEQL